MSTSGKATNEARELLAARRLDVLSPGPQAPEPQLASVIRLKITDVMVYERNPRRASHERIVELKESIRANGIEQIVTVTRRPGETRYLVAKGGNSRVTAATALYDETRDERFCYYDFVFVPWPGEAKLLAAHLRENDQRADLCFWDKANGYLALKADLEAERGGTLSLREFSRLLEHEGVSVSHVLLSLFQFAVDRLSALGPATLYLSRRALVDVIQPGMGVLLRLARRLGLDDSWVQERVIDPELVRIAAACSPDRITDSAGTLEQRAPFDAAQLVSAWRRRFAGEFGVGGDALDRMCHLLEHMPNASGDDLREVGHIRVQTSNPSSGASTVEHNDPPAMQDGSGKRIGDQVKLPDVRGTATAPPYAVEQRTAGSASEPYGQHGVPHDGSTELADAGQRERVSQTASGLNKANEGELFRETVLAFAGTCGLDGCVRDAPGLPYGFMVEPPPPDRLRFSLDTEALRDEGALNRYLGWWWLVSLSRQNTASGLERVPRDSLYAQMARDEDSWNRACDVSVGEPLLADRMDVMFDVVLNPDRRIGQWWADLIQVARAFRAAHPERFVSPRWPELAADERLQRGGP
ncbi:ParB family protein [Burkholderia multivorans]|uniref:ParB family protein n=1 Tax=Burkholderia multivorans TaxID=87883 RepID=UPI001C22A33E|nr:ParB family protein [Burkholderia multivorans]MBU9477978.1 ParB N-terminal domain-containing protein [Burkholderia multivorans]